MLRRSLLKGLAAAVAGSAAVGAGQETNNKKQLIVHAVCNCGWETKFILVPNVHGFYRATEGLCPECFNLLDQTFNYEDNPIVEVAEQKRIKKNKETRMKSVDVRRKKAQERIAIRRTEERLKVLREMGDAEL